MPVMRCPRCQTALNVPDVLVGHSVACIQCQHQFVATYAATPPPPQQPQQPLKSAGPTGPYYGPVPYGGYPPYGPPLKTSGHAIASMVLGIVAIPMCSAYGVPSLVCGILAVVFAKTAGREIAAGRVSPTSAGMAKAGTICGWIGIGLSIAMWAFFLIMLVIGLSAPGWM